MYQFDLTTVGGFLASLWGLMRGVLSLDPAAYQAALAQTGGARLSVAALFVSGLSITLGQSVVLFANRIPRRRFVFSLALSSLLLLVGVLFWAATVWLLAAYLFGAQQPFRSVLIVVSLSYAPLLYGVLVLLPYLGGIIDILLRVWIVVGVVAAVMVIFPLAFWQAVVCCLLGWLFLELATRFPLVTAVESYLWRITAGAPELLSTADAVDSFVQDLRAASRPPLADGSDEAAPS
ncbi:MAG: hypothetical protein IPM39_17265 [Chloroflexi bacterium]|nr:hypothetical protein [Chloroflexota bacterium]